MGNKEWDNHLRDLLGDFKSEGEPSHWEEFEHQLDTTSDPAESAERLQDEILQDKLSSYSPPDQVTGWDRIEASLDAAESEFDDQVRTRISAVSYTHLRAHETVLDLVCRLLLEKTK